MVYKGLVVFEYPPNVHDSHIDHFCGVLSFLTAKLENAFFLGLFDALVKFVFGQKLCVTCESEFVDSLRNQSFGQELSAFGFKATLSQHL